MRNRSATVQGVGWVGGAVSVEDCLNQSYQCLLDRSQQIHVLQTLLHRKKKDAAVGARADVMRETGDCDFI